MYEFYDAHLYHETELFFYTDDSDMSFSVVYCYHITPFLLVSAASFAIVPYRAVTSHKDRIASI
jgi:hypothetical protein